MKILIFNENTHSGGLDTFIYTLINAWPSQSDEIILICNEDHAGLKVIQSRLKRPCLIRTHNILSNRRLDDIAYRYHPIIFFMKKICTPVLKYLFLVWHIFVLRHILLKDYPDRLIVVNGGYPGGDLCRASVISWQLFSKKPKAILNIHNLAVPTRWFEKIQEWFIDYCVGKSSKFIVTVSKSCSEALFKRPFLVRGNKSIWIYNGLFPLNGQPRVSADILKKELSLPQNSKICLTLATYEPRKGHPFLIDSFKSVVKRLPETYLILCGYGTQKEMHVVEDLIQKSPIGSHIRLLGFRDDVPSLIASAELLLVPSQSYESFGLTCLEAFQFKKPVVATNVGGLPEVIGNGGIIVERSDTNGFANTIVKLLSDEDLRAQLGEEGFRRYQKYFTADRMAREYALLL